MKHNKHLIGLILLAWIPFTTTVFAAEEFMTTLEEASSLIIEKTMIFQPQNDMLYMGPAINLGHGWMGQCALARPHQTLDEELNSPRTGNYTLPSNTKMVLESIQVGHNGNGHYAVMFNVHHPMIKAMHCKKFAQYKNFSQYAPPFNQQEWDQLSRAQFKLVSNPVMVAPIPAHE